MDIAAINARLWDMHYEVKALLFFRPKSIWRHFKHDDVVLSERHEAEAEADLAEDLTNAPAEHRQRLKPKPSGIRERGPQKYTKRQRAGLVVGPLLFLLIMLAPLPSEMKPEAKRMAAVVCLMATWWMTESIPIPATSLLPVILFPTLGIMKVSETTAPYGSHLIFLFMGGFIIALAMQRWELHRRVAMNIIRVVGFSPGRLIFGFMASTAVLSAFVSNTATAVMMMPIGLAIITHVVNEGKKEGLDETIDFTPENFNFGLNLMLGIAYGASIGGIATLIGSPPNTVLAGYLQENYGLEISFLDWLKVGLPLVIVFLPACWFWLTRIANPMQLKLVPGGKDLIDEELKKMGPMSKGERYTAMVFGATAFAWVFRKQVTALLVSHNMLGWFPGAQLVDDSVVAMCGAVLLFFIPVDRNKNLFVMDWHWASKMPGGILLLFGGGLSMANGVKQTGLANWIGSQVGLLQHAPILVLLLCVVLLTIFLTELTSNTATAATVIPILAAVATGIHQNPLMLVIPAAVVSSCAFMLPAATPPNAIVFGSGYISIPQMVKSGVGLNILGIILTVTITWFLVIPMFGIEIGVLPAWAGGH